ncbi:MAG: winged helix-turn-helix domain-containing protein, partial [Ramlibacter sp.]
LTVDGVTIALEPRVFDVLVHLAQRRPRIVRASELCDSVWHASANKPQRLANYIKKARRALRGGDSDADSDPEYIRTVYGLGYQFVGQVEWRKAQ